MLQQQRTAGRDRRGGAHRHMPRLSWQMRDQAGDDAGEELFSGVHTNASTNSSIYRWKPARVFAA
ncbi:MAG: hypothetical protein ACREUS_05975, partial [Burkholderiales bacterium]